MWSLPELAHVGQAYLIYAAFCLSWMKRTSNRKIGCKLLDAAGKQIKRCFGTAGEQAVRVPDAQQLDACSGSLQLWPAPVTDLL